MKTLIFLSLLMFFGKAVCQIPGDQAYRITFEDSVENRKIIIDTISNQNNIWQIGIPSKAFFDSAYSSPRAILTDTLNFYPVNDTSSFYVYHVAGVAFDGGSGDAQIYGRYKVDCDSLNDYGKIEFSYDGGENWIDLLSPDFDEYLNVYRRPVLTGKQDWSQFGIRFLNHPWEIIPGDTITFRFTFISDGIQDNREGLMFDDLTFVDWIEGVELNGMDVFPSTVYPNPADSKITILSEVDEGIELCLQIFDYSGRLIETRAGQFEKEIELEIDRYLPGVYYYVLEDRQDFRRSTGKFVVR